MSLRDAVENATPTGFPRVSGDEPAAKGAGSALLGFSPRERG